MRDHPEIITASWNSVQLNADVTKGFFLERVGAGDDDEYLGGDDTPLQAAGVFARPRRLHSKTVVYAGFIQADPAASDLEASLRGYMTTFETTFVPTTHGDLVEQLEDGSSRSLDVRAFGRMGDRPNPEFVECSITFVSYESPDWDVTPAGS